MYKWLIFPVYGKLSEGNGVYITIGGILDDTIYCFITASYLFLWGTIKGMDNYGWDVDWDNWWSLAQRGKPVYNEPSCHNEIQ